MTVKTASSTSKTTAAKKAKPAAPKTPFAKPQTARTSPSAPVKAKRAASPKAASPKSAPAKAAQAAAPVQAKPTPVSATTVAKDKKVKVVRDSFTIPKNEYSQLGDMKKKALGLGLEIKKSELIRAGLLMLNAASDASFKKALSNVPTLKTGRPGKN